MIFLQQVSESFVGQLLQRLHGIQREAVNRVPSLRVELDALSDLAI